MNKPTLYGYDASTYVRTVRMVLAEKGLDYDLVPVNVLAGETRQPEHLARHPFGKVPVFDVDGLRLRETDAIVRYLEDKYGAPTLVPDNAPDRARMAEAISLINSYGYTALISIAAHHLFPELLGGKNEAAHEAALEAAMKLLNLVMENKGDRPWLAGDQPTLADYFLGPIIYYVSLTPDGERLLAVPGMRDWWERMKGLESFRQTEPNLS